LVAASCALTIASCALTAFSVKLGLGSFVKMWATLGPAAGHMGAIAKLVGWRDHEENIQRGVKTVHVVFRYICIEAFW